MRPLLHIGYHKTGTTWLQRHVFGDAGSGFSQLGGAQRLIAVNAFDFRPKRIRKQMERKMGLAQGLVPVLSSERLSGEPHFGGYDSEIIADRLAAVFPNARILIVVREQMSMFLSIYKEYIRRGGAASLRQYLATPRDGYWMPQFRFEFLEYHRLIGYYQHHFGAESVMVLPYELLRARPGRFLGMIGEFVGVPVVEPQVRPVNVSLSALALSLKRHANRYFVLDGPVNPAPPFDFPASNELLERMFRMLDSQLPITVHDRLERRWRRSAAREVGTRYAASNAVTADLTGLDLRAFGYVCE
ncbi:MAG: sulfotransferase [Rubrobacteraceae bacterium]|nr:sulfotransferase [Rubrobacteraceae bacterium]MDQ3251652.1 sulfotransferase [Actinomycetota bacterium]MDQ3496234.1 sulfotransferase [Actinomycetota bacterium]